VAILLFPLAGQSVADEHVTHMPWTYADGDLGFVDEAAIDEPAPGSQTVI
jgi:hypothetical protein